MFMCCTKQSSVINLIYSGQEFFSYNKLECLPLASLSSLIQYLRVRLDPTQVEHVSCEMSSPLVKGPWAYHIILDKAGKTGRIKCSSLFGLFISDEERGFKTLIFIVKVTKLSS
jgi:hypothetical protein